MNPKVDNKPKPRWYGYVHGSEYKGMIGDFHQEIPCSVCRSPVSTTIMVPGTLSCPAGWMLQYSGHLVSDYTELFATDYVCMDVTPETMTAKSVLSNGNLAYYVLAVCGSLPCPPYVNETVVTCAVCSF